MPRKKRTVSEELEAVRKRARGVLKPEHVVRFAENPKTALHGCFEWNDAIAGHQYRLEQARHLIRVVQFEPESSGPEMLRVRKYASLSDERRDGLSYRAITDVMADADLRARFLDQALREADSWRRRYERLTELAPVFAAIKKVGRKRKGKAA